MAKRLLIAWAIFAGALAIGNVADAADTPQTPSSPTVETQNIQLDGGAAPAQQGQAAPGAAGQTPPARLIKKRGETHTAERTHPHPLDERCKPLNDELEVALQKPGNVHRLFEARLAHNAGSRLCRDGHPERGIAELERGLSYLQETPRP